MFSTMHQKHQTQINMNVTHEASKPERSQSDQGLLFPQSGLKLCDQIGLNRWAAAKLHDDGWLSFDPETTAQLTENQEYEIRFVGALVTGGCGPALLEKLLEDLEKPYCYAYNRIYYDWEAREWRAIPDLCNEIETLVEEWINDLKDQEDTEQLKVIKAIVDDALNSLKIEE